MTSPATDIPVVRSGHRLTAEPRRVMARPFRLGDDLAPDGRYRERVVIDRVLSMSEDEVHAAFSEVIQRFRHRHRDLNALLDAHFQNVRGRIGDHLGDLPESRRRLIGAYFTMEIAIEGAALCNPSMVIVPGDAPPGDARFVMSIRAIGEGHISSIEFRSGTLGASGGVELDDPGRWLTAGRRVSNPVFDGATFRRKLLHLGAHPRSVESVLTRLGDSFTLEALDRATRALYEGTVCDLADRETIRIIHWLGSSNYDMRFDASTAMSERVLYPESPIESRGMEDARFVRFVEDNGSVVYYATYTAYDGHRIMPQMIATNDFLSFRVRTLHGNAAQNKGMALFPRRVNGRYAMIGRVDKQNMFFLTSDDVHHWEDASVLRGPEFAWEAIQIGNCGSPIETPEGWVLLTHGVGPMRRYTLGAVLLDLEHPNRVIGALPRPLLEPNEQEREGYVPNVVYSCGGAVHAGFLHIPYGMSDGASGIATVRLDELVAALRRNPVRA